MKRILITVFFILSITHSRGQVIHSIGIKSGISFANQTWQYISVDRTLRKQYIQGYYFVATTDVFNLKFLSFSADFGICQKGSRDKYEVTTIEQPEGFNAVYNTEFNYFTTSSMLKARYQVINWSPYALLGIRLDYQLSYQSDLYLNNIDNSFNKTIYGLTTGAGFEYKIKNLGLNLEFQYHYDFSNLTNIPVSKNNTGLVITNNAYITSIGVKYYFHRAGDFKTT